jgi:AraC-like DNA-binding protein
VESTPPTFFRYLPVSSGDKQWELYVPTAGYSWTAAHSPLYPLTRHPSAYHFEWRQGRILQEFQLLYIVRGQGVFESATAGQIPIRAGQAFMLFPGEWHRYRPDPATGWDEYWIGFDGGLPRRLVQQRVFTPKAPVFTPESAKLWHDRFAHVVQLLEIDPTGVQQLLASHVFEMLAQLSVQDRAARLGQTLDDTAVRQAKHLIMRRLTERIDWEELARELHVSYSALRHAFQQHTGFSLYQYQLQLRLEKARHLLNGTALSIKAIAGETGFDCPDHFSHLFRRKIGRSPLAWRRDARGGQGPHRTD